MVFLGNSPQNAPALYSIMSHMDLKSGVWYPRGGMGMIVDALVKLCRQEGAELELNCEVKSFAFKNNRITHCISEKESFPADLVVWAADYPFCELSLLAPESRTYDLGYWQKRVYAPSMFILYLGLDKKIPQLKHHNLYFSYHWQNHFQAIFKKPHWPENPCFYLCCPSFSDATVAPEGKENLFLLVPVAAGLEEADERIESYSEYILAHLEKIISEKISSALIVKRIFSLRDFAADYNAYRSTALGLAHTLFQTAVFRPAQQSKRVANLFYCGQYTHPGVGVPMVLISAEVLAENLTEKFGN